MPPRFPEPRSARPPFVDLIDDFPVLSVGPTPRVPLDAWTFTECTESGDLQEWSWSELISLPVEQVTADIHCVTRWSRLDTVWRGVSVDTLLAEVSVTRIVAPPELL